MIMLLASTAEARVGDVGVLTEQAFAQATRQYA